MDLGGLYSIVSRSGNLRLRSACNSRRWETPVCVIPASKKPSTDSSHGVSLGSKECRSETLHTSVAKLSLAWMVCKPSADGECAPKRSSCTNGTTVPSRAGMLPETYRWPAVVAGWTSAGSACDSARVSRTAVGKVHVSVVTCAADLWAWMYLAIDM